MILLRHFSSTTNHIGRIWKSISPFCRGRYLLQISSRILSTSNISKLKLNLKKIICSLCYHIYKETNINYYNVRDSSVLQGESITRTCHLYHINMFYLLFWCASLSISLPENFDQLWSRLSTERIVFHIRGRLKRFTYGFTLKSKAW